MAIKVLKVPQTLEIIYSLVTLSIYREWWHKTSNQKWCFFYGCARMMFKPIGIPLCEETIKNVWYGLCSHALVGTYFALAVYTAVHYTMIGEIGKCVSCFCLLMIIVCYLPFVSATRSKECPYYNSLLTFPARYIHYDNHDKTEYNRLCQEAIDETVGFFLIKAATIIFGSFLAILGPVYVFIAYGTKTTTTEVKVPYIEETSPMQYTMNVLLQFIVYVHGGFVYFGMEIAMSLFQHHINLTPRLIKQRLTEFDEAHEKFSKVKTLYVFKDIVKQLLDYESWICGLRDFLYWRTLLTPIIFTYAIALSIFCQLTLGFVAGFGIAAMSWVQFFFICETGQKIEDTDLDVILYHSNWYNTPVKVQLDLARLIHQRQNAAALTVGPFGSVNRFLLKDVTNSIYTFTMFLLNFTQ